MTFQQKNLKIEMELFRLTNVLIDVSDNYGYILYTLMSNKQISYKIGYSYEYIESIDKNGDKILELEFKPHYSYGLNDKKVPNNINITKDTKKKMDWYLKMVKDLLDYVKVNKVFLEIPFKYKQKINTKYNILDISKICIKNLIDPDQLLFNQIEDFEDDFEDDDEQEDFEDDDEQEEDKFEDDDKQEKKIDF